MRARPQQKKKTGFKIAKTNKGYKEEVGATRKGEGGGRVKALWPPLWDEERPAVIGSSGKSEKRNLMGSAV